MTKKTNKKKSNTGRVVTTVLLFVALAVFCYSGVQLVRTLNNYKASDAEYSDLAKQFTSEAASSENTSQAEIPPELQGELIEDAVVPLDVDLAGLKAANEDVKGWLYVDGLPNISYPVLHGPDNDLYLHHTFRKESLFAGSIFMDYQNSSDFSDPTTIVYGHNMRNGSMFGMLRKFKEQEFYDTYPYFWILTDEGCYRYHIYSVMSTNYKGEVYTLFSGPGQALLEWEEKMQSLSVVKNDVALSENDHNVILSTCTSDSSVRLVVIGKCVSSVRPKVRQNIPYGEAQDGQGENQGVSAYN